MVALDSSAGPRAGIDFGHRHLRVAVSDLSHTVLAETWRELDVDHSADDGLDAAAEFVDEVLAEAGRRAQPRDRRRDGAAPRRSTAAPAPSRTPRSSPAGSGSTPPRRRARGSGLPVEVENDANLGALAELVWGAAKGQLRGRLHQGRVGHRRRADLRRAPASTASAAPPARSATRSSPRAARSAAAATAAAWRRWRRPAAIAELLSESRARADLDAAAARALRRRRRRRAAADRRRGPGDRRRGREPLQPRQPRVRGHRRRPERRRRRPARADARGRRAATRSRAPPRTLEIVAGVLGERAEMLGALALVMHESERFAAPELEAEAA